MSNKKIIYRPWTVSEKENLKNRIESGKRYFDVAIDGQKVIDRTDDSEALESELDAYIETGGRIIEVRIFKSENASRNEVIAYKIQTNALSGDASAPNPLDELTEAHKITTNTKTQNIIAQQVAAQMNEYKLIEAEKKIKELNNELDSYKADAKKKDNQDQLLGIIGKIAPIAAPFINPGAAANGAALGAIEDSRIETIFEEYVERMHNELSEEEQQKAQFVLHTFLENNLIEPVYQFVQNVLNKMAQNSTQKPPKDFEPNLESND